jgi:hypothetical protein
VGNRWEGEGVGKGEGHKVVETLNRKSKRGLSRCLHLIATGNGAHKKTIHFLSNIKISQNLCISTVQHCRIRYIINLINLS